MNRTRSQIVRFLLRNGPSTSGEVGSELGVSQPAIRRHLALLRCAGLVEASAAARFTARPDQVLKEIEAIAATFTIEVKP
ncbi:helix-turn-helix domain-containing protein [Arthrobacter sp. HLT1-21]